MYPLIRSIELKILFNQETINFGGFKIRVQMTLMLLAAIGISLQSCRNCTLLMITIRLFLLIGNLPDLLSSMDQQIAKAKEQALSRRDILDKFEKWNHASQEENWLDEYERVMQK